MGWIGFGDLDPVYVDMSQALANFLQICNNCLPYGSIRDLWSKNRSKTSHKPNWIWLNSLTFLKTELSSRSDTNGIIP